MTTPTPRDLFGGSRGLDRFHARPFQLGSGKPTILPAEQNTGLFGPAEDGTTGSAREEHRGYGRREIEDRPERSYGSESMALLVGLRLMSWHDFDGVSWTGSPAIRPVHRESTPPEESPGLARVHVPATFPGFEGGQAACRTLDPEEAFEGSPRAAKACQVCPIRQSCLDWAVDHNEDGWWGGTSKPQRTRIRNARRAAS